MKPEDWKRFVAYASKSEKVCKWRESCLCKRIFRLVDEGCRRCAKSWLKENKKLDCSGSNRLQGGSLRK